jgi:hypothetical protein
MKDNITYELYEHDSVSGVKKRAKKLSTIIDYLLKNIMYPRSDLFFVVKITNGVVSHVPLEEVMKSCPSYKFYSPVR